MNSNVIVLAKEKESVRRKLAITAKELRLKAKQLAITAKEKESVRRKLAITAKELRLKAKQLAITAKEKESVRRKLLVTAKKLAVFANKLAITAKEKESVRRTLVVTAEEKESVRRKLLVTAEEKESVRRTLAITARKLAVAANKFAVVAKEKESVRRTLAVTAKEKESVRRTLAVTAEELRLKAKQLAITAKEKESVRRTLAVTAEKLKRLHETLENKVLERTKDLEQIRAKNEAILTSIGDGLVVVDKEGRISYINKSFEEMLGWKTQEIIGRTMVEVVPREDASGVEVSFKERILTQVLAGEKFIADLTNPFYYIRKNKSRFPASSIVAPVVLGGKTIGAVEVFRDITKEKEIDKAKTEFVSLTSHQLRTPLTTVNWYAEMLLKGDVGKVDSKQKKYLEEIYSSNQRMVELVNTLLDVSRIELGTLLVESKPTDIIALAQSVLDEQKPKITEKKLIVTHRFSKGDGVFLVDPKLLRMVFQNLLANAVTYTPNGGKIEFSVSFDTKKIVLVKVSDTGYGIPKNQQNQIFSKLFRADNVRDKDTRGTGLGLYIIKSIIENYGGKIWFVSPANAISKKTIRTVDGEEIPGSTFYATLTLDKVKKRLQSNKK